MAWTEAQQKVIDTRNKNLLVSAAAGSGKTAVLVERIISMICEGDRPMDIDHLLVVTFTNAAAAEMRERIGKAIDRKLAADPDNEHLQKQISLLQSAQITTIHSFCLNVIRNYFHRIDLDPSFKIAEESEITLMKSDVVSEILERWYEEGREDFHAFIESYSYSKSDAPVEELIRQLYNFSMSDPWPKEWIEEKKRMFGLKSLEEMYQAPWMKQLSDYIRFLLQDLLDKNTEAIGVCNETGGPSAYLPALLSDRGLLEELIQASSYEECAGMFSNITFERLSSKREEGVEVWKKDRVKDIREEIKKGLKDLTNQYFFQAPEEMLKDLQAVDRVMKVLFDLTLEFMEVFAKKKEEKNLIDFNDLEHFALKILINEDKEPTAAAAELSELFEEILIDEYQDSNMVQETILRSISREDQGKPNRFMVGDVKQSIYKFRLAMPEIFMQKYGAYPIEDKDGNGLRNLYQRIDLDRNFRSRKQVLDYVNQIFEQIMQPSVGGIRYDEAAALKYGELYDTRPEAEDRKIAGSKGETIDENKDETKDEIIDETKDETKDSTEDETIDETKAGTKDGTKIDDISRIACDVDLLLVTEEELSGSANESGTGLENASDSPEQETVGANAEDPEEVLYTKKEIEARAIAKRIKELTDPDTGLLVTDKATKELRPAAYRDIVILLRSMSNWSEVFVDTLMKEGISAYADTGTGYFQTLEIMTLLNMIRIIDNPRQDIPLAGVLYSPIAGLSSTELALVRASNRNVCMYDAVLSYVGEGGDEELRSKLKRFMEQLSEYRDMVNHKPIHELIQYILDTTGYYHYVTAMPGGDRRKANIDMLISQAVRFEKGSYSGLFHFIRYIEKLHKYEVDFGEASVSGEQDDTVRIMSIHKSKGLEFPIVIVAGMNKQFNTQDIRNSIVLHSELGAGPEYIDSQMRTKVPTLLKKVIQKKVQIENLGEELRVLYVAMTRAREKLILTGYLDSLKNITKKNFSFLDLSSSKSYMDWVLPAMVNKMGKRPPIEALPFRWKQEGMSISILSRNDFLKQEVEIQLFRRKDREELMAISSRESYDSDVKEEIKTRFNYEYPYIMEAGIKIKMTVTELKKLGQFQDEEQSVNLYQDAPKTASPEPAAVTVPAFIRQAEPETTGTDRGTLYHKVLELLDLSKVHSKEDVLREMERMADENRINSEDIRKLKQDYIYNFSQSNIAGRMKKAQHSNRLYKEKQFVMGIKASEVLKDSDSEELILIQGIIDVFFEEEDGLVLLDYKSDLVDSEEILIRRYQVQLEYYKRALEQMLKKPVKEMVIYSLPLGREIRIEPTKGGTLLKADEQISS